MEDEREDKGRFVSFSTIGGSFSAKAVSFSVGIGGIIILISMIALFNGYSFREITNEKIAGTKIGFIFIVTTSIGLIAYQHKAKFTRNANSEHVRFLKQFTPFMVYSSRELEIKKLTLNQFVTTHSRENGGQDYRYITKIYYSDREIFSCPVRKWQFEEILPELFIDSEEI
ncbi:MAG TPA: hypothetical protein HA356_07545 [Candidatus Poseidoniaceae archaeon]|nr:MAG TPA: hypothetical protein D7H95_07520 [Candidatus Poseidoniales archaeon]HII11910.1 hypothetical protein [Candidatus Poseidoniaceae archaeon]